ncbi:Outer membrane low permeability porin, OprD family [Pseudomonas chlororaphis subsp. aurantiaca]|nr:Outer membrane low permeability porin, OprD family [Pseudomonas chlororaphis subsp. aurantiaca]
MLCHAQALSGRIGNTTWSLMSTYRSGAHSFGLGYQKVDGDTPYDYVTRGAILLSNAVALSDFNAPEEASWQARYDLNMAGYQVPGLTFRALYVRGSGIDPSTWCSPDRRKTSPSPCATPCTAATRPRPNWMPIWQCTCVDQT